MMKCARLKPWALLGLFFCLAVGLFLLAIRRPRIPGDWLQAGAPTFDVATNAAGPHPFLALWVSNAGPYSLEVQIRWFECRLKSDPSSEPPLRPSFTGRPVLPSGAAQQIRWDFNPNSPSQECLCCCAFEWQQHASWRWRTATKWVDPALAWIQNCVEPGWKAYTWSLADWLEPLADGLVFTSNVPVDDYFHLVYGLDRVKSSQKLAESPSPASTNAPGTLSAKPLTPSLAAQRAFNSYCVAVTRQQPALPAKPVR